MGAELSEGASAAIAKTIEKAAEKTGAKVNVVGSAEEIKDERVKADVLSGKKVTGWYDEKTGEVHLYMPNIKDSYTAEKTVWHETVGHKGMRGLLGDGFDGYMRGLWMDLDNPVNKELRAFVRERMKQDHLGFYDAIEEYIAKSAEEGRGEPGFWNYIKNKVTDALRETGYRVSPNVKDVKWMLWLAKNVQKHGSDPWWKMRAEAVRWKIEHERTEYTKIEGGELYDNDGESHDFEGMSREEWKAATDGEIHYRTAPSAATALDRYHKMLDRHGYMATEAFMDNMLSLKHLMEAIDPKAKKVEDVAASMNPYLMQNITEGKMAMKAERFREDYMVPLDKAMAGVLDSFDGKTQSSTSTASVLNLENGYQAGWTGTFKWTRESGKKDPTSASGNWTSLPKSGVASAAYSTPANVTSDTTISVTLAAAKTGLMVSGASVVLAKGNDTKTAQVKVNFLHRRRWGLTSESSVTAAVVKSLSGTDLSGSKTMHLTGISATDAQYYVIAYPKAMGELTKIVQNGATPLLNGGFVKSEVTVVNDAGASIAYLVYRTEKPGALKDSSYLDIA